eukprot:snap_masked-scaffold_2-processed-gene-4.31-mRNA-1 protein AED:0.20 eAED:1.00 QI:0/-1/0/1/-1/1/1/0/394
MFDKRKTLKYISIVALTGAVGYFAVKKVVNKGLKKLENLSANLEKDLQQSLQKERVRKAEIDRLKQDPSVVLKNFLSLLNKEIKKLTDPKEITSELRDLRTKSKDVQEQELCWEKLKLISLSRLFTSFYALSVLHSLIWVQQHIVSRNELDDKDAVSKEEKEKVFVSALEYFLDDGLVKLESDVQGSLEKVSKSWKMGSDQKIYVEEIIDLVYALRGAFEPGSKGTHANTFFRSSFFCRYAIRDPAGLDQIVDFQSENPALEEILDMVECPLFDSVTSTSLDLLFDHLVKNLVRFKPYSFLQTDKRDKTGSLVLTKVIVSLMKEVSEDVLKEGENGYIEAMQKSTKTEVSQLFANEVFAVGEEPMPSIPGMDQMLQMLGGDDEVMKMFQTLAET